METTVDAIFNGTKDHVDFSFLSEFILESREVRCNIPEVSLQNTDVLTVIEKASYIDLVVNTDRLRVYDHIVEKVFINLGIDQDRVDVLLFLDACDIGLSTAKENFDLLHIWAGEFQKKYQLQSFVCQIDNGNKDEYYFDSEGMGPFYHLL